MKKNENEYVFDSNIMKSDLEKMINKMRGDLQEYFDSSIESMRKNLKKGFEKEKDEIKKNQNVFLFDGFWQIYETTVNILELYLYETEDDAHFVDFLRLFSEIISISGILSEDYIDVSAEKQHKLIDKKMDFDKLENLNSMEIFKMIISDFITEANRTFSENMERINDAKTEEEENEVFKETLTECAILSRFLKVSLDFMIKKMQPSDFKFVEDMRFRGKAEVIEKSINDDGEVVIKKRNIENSNEDVKETVNFYKNYIKERNIVSEYIEFLKEEKGITEENEILSHIVDASVHEVELNISNIKKLIKRYENNQFDETSIKLQAKVIDGLIDSSKMTKYLMKSFGVFGEKAYENEAFNLMVNVYARDDLHLFFSKSLEDILKSSESYVELSQNYKDRKDLDKTFEANAYDLIYYSDVFLESLIRRAEIEQGV